MFAAALDDTIESFLESKPRRLKTLHTTNGLGYLEKLQGGCNGKEEVKDGDEGRWVHGMVGGIEIISGIGSS